MGLLKLNFRFIDLFAGIGGFRVAGEQNGGSCAFSSEVNKDAAETYAMNHGDKPAGDIVAIDASDIPQHDVLFGGFPCQPFSICGHLKGFDDVRGTLFFEILRIAAHHRPRCLVLENVKNFKNHDKGNTIAVVINSLEQLGYRVTYKVLNAVGFGLPQNRERTIIVASLGTSFDFDQLNLKRRGKLLDILEKDSDFQYLDEREYTLLPEKLIKVQPQTGLRFVGYRNRNLRKVGVREGTEHLSRVHKQPNRIYCASGTHPTLAAGESSGRYWISLDGRVRKLTLRECYRLQGFHDGFRVHPTLTAAYKQIGNSVPIPMISEVIRSAIKQGII